MPYPGSSCANCIFNPLRTLYDTSWWGGYCTKHEVDLPNNATSTCGAFICKSWYTLEPSTSHQENFSCSSVVIVETGLAPAEPSDLRGVVVHGDVWDLLDHGIKGEVAFLSMIRTMKDRDNIRVLGWLVNNIGKQYDDYPRTLDVVEMRLGLLYVVGNSLPRAHALTLLAEDDQFWKKVYGVNKSAAFRWLYRRVRKVIAKVLYEVSLPCTP